MVSLHPAELGTYLSYGCRSLIIVQERDMKFGLFIGDVRNEAFDHDVEKGGLLITRESWHRCRDVLITYSVGKIG